MRTALITGARGGLGQAIAERLAADGMNLILTDRVACSPMEDVLRSAAVQIVERPCDLGDEADIDRFLGWVATIGRPVDVLINNAADQRLATLDQIGIDHFRRVLRVNLEAPFLLSHALGRKMAERGWGRIVNLVSGSAWSPPPGFISYISSKMGLIGLTRSMAMELGAFGVTVNGVSPALTAHSNNAGALPEAIWAVQREKQAIKRTATPRDLVGLVSFLCSDDADFVTGQTMFADGGGLML